MIIKDKLLEPYQVKVEDNNYILYKPRVSKKGYDYYNNAMYFTSLESSLEKLILIRLEEDQRTVDLKEFTLEFKKLKKQFKLIIG